MNSLYDEFANVMIEDGEIPVEPSIPSTVEEAKNSGETFEETTEIKDDLDNNVTIPGGFHVADDSGTKVEEGVVIEDDAGNQFVWIPVGTYKTANEEKTNNLSRRIWADKNIVEEPTEVDGDEAINYYFWGEGYEYSNSKDQIEGFKTSVNSNDGFYIGRYEQGEGNVCKASENPYNSVTKDEAKTQAEAMYNGNEFVTSELISSYAWDTALNFICQNSEEGYLLATTVDSKYGNIGTGIARVTGGDAADNYCNIHDFLGNYFEWTTEYSSDEEFTCIYRGGNYYHSDNYTAYCGYDFASSKGNYSFRIQLYLK